MMELHSTQKTERAIVVGLVANKVSRYQVRDYLDELIRLADTAGVEVVHKITQERDGIQPATYLGKGKINEIALIVEQEKIELVIFDDDLSAMQVRNLEKVIKCKIIDRSGLILDIFASRAKTKEAMTQVELAQLQYMLPRLTRAWTHLSKQYGGVGTKGPGETQLEVDRRAVRTRIGHLKEKLEGISVERSVQRSRRKEWTRVALVGYTNAGKSTLLKQMSGADVFIEDRLFATLDTTVRQVAISQTKRILLSDTVGFIRKLPPHLIASFRSTLAEVVEADVVLHVVDVSHPQFEEHVCVVRETLQELGAGEKPTVMVFNKIDALQDRALVTSLGKEYENAVFISASRGINISSLKEKILEVLEHELKEQVLHLMPSDYRLISKLHEFVEILEKEYDEDNTMKVRFRFDKKFDGRLKKLLGRSGIKKESLK
ncbi:MAG: GTPase HflX [Ignavibacteriae bacterium]|nr:GTPase HflX [Ignavibacteriota bacterium]